jgi:hypothetical protein
MAIFYNTKIVTNGLVLCLDAANSKSYPGSGTTWSDLSKNGYNGSLVNSPTFVNANGGYFAFDYTNDYVTTTGMQNFSYATGITVSVWHYNGGGTGFYRGVVNNGTVADRLGGFDLRYGREDYFGGDNNGTKLNWAITNSSGTTTGMSIFANINEWHCYTCMYDNSVLRAYKDGVLFNSSSHSSGGQLKTMSDSTTIGVSPGTSEYLDGRLSQVLIYNKVLSASDITNNFQALRGRYGL